MKLGDGQRGAPALTEEAIAEGLLRLPLKRKNKTPRKNADKPMLTLIPYRPLAELARVYEVGAVKYELEGWRAGYSFADTCDSLLRHAMLLKEGYDLDEETGLAHAAQIMWNCCVILEQYHTHPELDDRYKGREPNEDWRGNRFGQRNFTLTLQHLTKAPENPKYAEEEPPTKL